MNIKEAKAIFCNIYNSSVSDVEKIEAIESVVINTAQIEDINKQEYSNALNWLIETYGQKENTDRWSEFLEKFKKICNEDNCHTNCPFDDEKEGCSFYKDDIHVIISKVEAWIKAHSITNLTERQKTAIKGRIAEGYLWVTKDKRKYGVSFFNKEQRNFGTYSSISYDYSDTSYCDLYNFVTKENSPIYLPDLLKENN
nr:MAG TPA: hypothetical protein [Caudoviricetes sp.]